MKQNGVNKRRTILTVTEAVETTLAVRSFFNSDSGRKQEREKSRRRIRLEENIYKSWLQAKLEATYRSTRNSEFAMNLCINQFQWCPSPPGQPRGICLRCQSRGLGISIPRGDPRTFDTRVFERWMSLSGRTRPLSKTALS